MRPSDERDPALSALEDSYELVRELGGTNATVVYLARVRSSGRLVALKTIRQQFLRNPEAAARFAREARTMSSLSHPNIVKTIAVEQLGDRTVAIVMEYLEGGTLRELLRSHGALTFEHARAILRDLGEALQYSHERGIVHRDVKPENIFIEAESGRALLSDFGIAREMEADTRLTLAGSAVGTPTYMSPEQIDGQEADERSDIYSLGVLGWELVTGLRPWDGETLYGVIYKQKHEELPPILTLRADTPASLREAIEGAMRKREEDRWQTAAAFLERLGDVKADMSGAGDEQSDDLPTLHFRRPEETMRGVPLADVARAAEESRPTMPIEREVSMQPVREPNTEVVQEPEVRRPRHTQPRRKLNVGDVPIPDVDVTAANAAAIAAAAAAEMANAAKEPELADGAVREDDSTPVAEPTLADELPAEVVAADTPAPAWNDTTPAEGTVRTERVDEDIDRNRRDALRIASDALGDDSAPLAVPPPRKRNPMLIAIPSALALAAALFLIVRRDGPDDERLDLTVHDSVVSSASGGSIAPTVNRATPRQQATDGRRQNANAESLRQPTARQQRGETPPARSVEEVRAARRPRAEAKPPVAIPAVPETPAVAPPVVNRDAAEPDNAPPLLDRIADNDVELNRVYQQLIGALRRGTGGAAEPASVRDLRAEQRGWLNKRDAACRAGTIEERARCFREQSQARASELNRRLNEARANPAGDTTR